MYYEYAPLIALATGIIVSTFTVVSSHLLIDTVFEYGKKDLHVKLQDSIKQHAQDNTHIPPRWIQDSPTIEKRAKAAVSLVQEALFYIFTTFSVDLEAMPVWLKDIVIICYEHVKEYNADTIDWIYMPIFYQKEKYNHNDRISMMIMMQERILKGLQNNIGPQNVCVLKGHDFSIAADEFTRFLKIAGQGLETEAFMSAVMKECKDKFAIQQKGGCKPKGTKGKRGN